MITIKPFRALRPKPELAARVVSKPYDVLSSDEAREETQGNAISFLHVTKSEIDLPEGTSPYDKEVYNKAKDNLDALGEMGVLFREEEPCLYFYELTMNDRVQMGIVCLSSLDDYDAGRIVKHELTRPEKEQDRISHIFATRAQTGNVFLTYRNCETMDLIMKTIRRDKIPEYDFFTDDGIRHRVWIFNHPLVLESICNAFYTKIDRTYIADGHHRAASAAKVRYIMGDDAPAGADYFLTTIFPDHELHIYDYNRLVRDLNGLSKEDFLRRIEEGFTIKPVEKAYSPTGLHEFGMYIDRQWYKLTAKEGSYTDDPIGVLDVSILQNYVLNKLLNIKDPKTDKRIDFVGGIRGLQELEERVNSGEMSVAFSLYPVSMNQLFDVADSGKIMPPKSTWFEPKLRDGLLTHLID